MGKVTSRVDPRSEDRIRPMEIAPVTMEDLPSDYCMCPAFLERITSLSLLT